MTSERDKDRENTQEVLSLQQFTALAAAGIARASRRATKDLQDDTMRILRTFAHKGGFDSLAEAKAYLDGFIEPADRQVLIDAAMRLPEPQRSQELIRLSAPAYNWRMTRKQAIDKAQKLATKRLNADLDRTLGPVYSRTVTEAVKRGEYSVQKQVGAAFRFDLPNERNIQQVLRGAGVYDKVRLFSAQEMETVKQIITDGMLSGRTADQVARAVSQATGKDLYKARRLARTTTAQAAVDAKHREFQELGITEYEIRCTLDERTCKICSQYDGKRYPLGKGPMPTFHPNCRCGIRQVIPDDVRARMTRAARDENGKSIKVPASMTYEEWNARYGKASRQTDLPPAPKFKRAETKPETKPAVPKGPPRPTAETYANVPTEEMEKLSDEELIALHEKRAGMVRDTYMPSTFEGNLPERYADVEYTDIDRVEDWAWYDSLTQEESKAIEYYSGYMYSQVNKPLFDEKQYLEESKGRRDRIEGYLKNMDRYKYLDDAIARFEVKEPIVVFRNMRASPFDGKSVDESLIGQEFTFPSYTSTTVGGYMEEFGNLQLRILVRKGKGSGAFIMEKSQNKQEQEFLIKRNARFLVRAINRNRPYGIEVTLEMIE